MADTTILAQAVSRAQIQRVPVGSGVFHLWLWRHGRAQYRSQILPFEGEEYELIAVKVIDIQRMRRGG